MNLHLNSLKLLSRMNFREIREQIAQSASLVVPLGAMEAVGPDSSLGIITACVEAVSSVFCACHTIALAPVINFSCSKPYKSFEGSAGLSQRTLSNTLIEICNDYIFQGFKRIVIVNPLETNEGSMKCVVDRLNKIKETVRIFSFHAVLSEGVRTIVAGDKGKEYGRSELGILSLAAFCAPEYIRKSSSEQKSFSIDEKRYTMWFKRGMDPQKFRKMFPDASTSEIASQYSALLGEELSDYLIKALERENLNFLLP